MESIARTGQPPQIVSPTPRQSYSLAEGENLQLSAVTDADAAKLYWFADQRFLGSASRGQTLAWSPTPGTYRLTALDDHGRAGMSQVVIEALPRP